MEGPSRVFQCAVLAAFALVVDALTGDASNTAALKTSRLGSSSETIHNLTPCQQAPALPVHTMVQVDATALHHQIASLRADLAARTQRVRMTELENTQMKEELHQLVSDRSAQVPAGPQTTPTPAESTTPAPTTPAPTTTGSPMPPVPQFQEIPPLATGSLLPPPPGMACTCTAVQPGQAAPTSLPGHAFTWSGYSSHGHAMQRDGKRVEDPELARALEQAMQASATAQQIQSTAHQPGFLDDLNSYHAAAKNSSKRVRIVGGADLARAAMEKPSWP